MIKTLKLTLVILLLFPVLDNLAQNYDYLQSGTAIDTVITEEDGSENTVASVTLNLGATTSKITKVLVVCGMNMRASGSSTNNREVVYEIKNSHGAEVSGEIVRRIQKKDDYDYGATTLVHIFDVSSLSGNVSFFLEQYNNLSGPGRNVETVGYVTAIALNTELNEYVVHSSNKRLGGTPVNTTSSTFSTVTGLESDALTLPLKGDVYVAASINCQESGGNEAVGEWVLQYQESGGGSWTDIGFPSQVTMASNSDNLIVTLVGLVRNLDPDDYLFRVGHRKVSGNGTVGTLRSNLVAVSLTHEGRAYFPAFYGEAENNDTITGVGSSATLTSATFTSAADISGTGPNMLMHTQYVALAHDLENNERMVSKHQVFIDNGTTEEGEVAFKRLLADNDDYGAGGFVGLAEDIDGATEYTVSIRHYIDSLVNETGDADSMTTSRVFLCGFSTFDQPTYEWDGSESSDWNTAANWVENEVPVSAGFTLIPDVATNDPAIDTHDSITRMGINSGGALTIENTGRLTIVGDLNVEGTLLIQADSDSTGSMIMGGESAGDVSIDSYLTADQWHIVSAPVTTQSINSFLSDPVNNIPDKSGDYGLTDYDETNNAWNSYFTLATGGNFTSGKGYLMRRETTDSIVNYTGEAAYEDVQVALTRTGLGWQAVGNPFTSAIGVTSDATSTDDFLTENLSQLDPNFSALYVWDEQPGYDGTRYDFKVIGNSGYVDDLSYTELNRDYIQSGQGFLLKSVTGGGTVTFTTGMRIHQIDETMLKTAPVSWDGFKLAINSGDDYTYTILTFHEGMTGGLDPSYDAGLYKADPGFSISSRLLTGDEGIDFRIQCLPELGTADFVIPVSLDLEGGKEVSFKTDGVIMPEGYRLILEDRENDLFTDLRPEGNTYDLVLNDPVIGTGRFFMHVFGSNTTSDAAQAVGSANVNVYYHHRRIVVRGSLSTGASGRLYDLNGKELGYYHLTGGTRNEIPVASLNMGIYVLVVNNGKENHTFKVPVF